MSGHERFFSPFQDCLNFVLYLVDGPNSLYRRHLTVGLQHHNELGVAQHRNVGIVGNEDELALASDPSDALDYRLVNESIVQVVLGLVDEKRAGGLQEEDREDGRALLPS